MRSRTGIAGCGRMGAPMLAALRAAGVPARGYDVVPMDSPHITDDIAVFSEELDTLVIVVRDIEQTEAVLFGEQNFAAIPSLIRIIICSTLSPKYVIGLRDRIPSYIALIDAPMSGAQIAAQEARLSFMLGGEQSDIDTAMPLFHAMGKHFHRMGDFGSGMQAKVLNNLLAASNTAMTRLVLDWADNAGLDISALLDLIHTSSGQNWFASCFNSIEFSRDGYAEGNTIAILVKDIESALDASPEGADTVLPELIQRQILALKPRTPKT
ncbi:NAD(P)-dependent oxidoreductase [Sulfitobacter guttiformis]|uniref:3-hydroxyisobutyrate dehydrogenase n=1 Tax=Sulfitobacter guttiformis TaxID=74349 RepID=A0A420DPI3_9RHOB|nr:NAD(P)-binding domain-containing protein [Sulfitobacter guttiformis]KIN73406.1 3-hydroxyisobutyrate dehydrogenase [Sulfitobacter guttiformis KCTC 32187]RKE96067.1 3-hydroxyisobutyrate dehydrogenase [Sulfitobacter guttiformis]